MKKLRIFRIFHNKYVNYSLLLILGLFLGWIFFHTSGNKSEKPEVITEAAQSTIWTCAMHPQIRMDHPGQCPICGMDLIPLAQSGSSSVDPDALHLTK